MNTDNKLSSFIVFPEADWSNRKMLVIEDDPESILLIKELFAATGLSIQIAANGEDGLQSLIQNPDTHVVLLDLRLPDMDGFSVLSSIRSMDRWIPVIAMTAAVVPETADECKKAGFYGFMPKPFEMNRFVKIVNEILQLQP